MSRSLAQPVAVLQEWFEEHWNEAEDVTPDILRIIERHVREYSPFEVYARALQEFFRGHELTAGEWERQESRVYPILDQYQREGYHALLKRAGSIGGAFLCDGVGLGKTFIGLMLIERLVMFERKRVALFVPKAARKPVWEKELKRYLPDLIGDFSNLVIFNHTDLLRGGEYPERFKKVKEMADVILIDEAHHFRNPGVKGEEDERQSRYWQLYDMAEGKTVFMLTATPVNNQPDRPAAHDRALLPTPGRLFQRCSARHPLSAGPFPRSWKRTLEGARHAAGAIASSDVETNQAEAEKVLSSDALFRELVVQRSRAYVKKSQEQQGGNADHLPDTGRPQGGRLFSQEDLRPSAEHGGKGFQEEKPLFSLAIYYPLAYYKGPDKKHRLLRARAAEGGRQPHPHSVPQTLRELSQGL